MTASEPIPGSREMDLIDRIAEALPLDIRADYYRELRHCRSLPDNDEMLRILRIMQFLTVLIHQVPERIVSGARTVGQQSPVMHGGSSDSGKPSSGSAPRRGE